jgi:uncharacterized protein (DUF427 family)
MYIKKLGNHPVIASLYDEIGDKYRTEDSSKEVSFYIKAAEIREAALGKRHPDTLESYKKIGKYYEYHNDYPTALLWYRKAADSGEETKP